jgi:3-oxoacyl-[acyl-carrier protein] reductase
MGTQREFAGRTALVTGGSRGIGRAAALALARAGAGVAINYRGNEAAAAEALRLIEEAGGAGMLVRADVADPAAVSAMVDAVERGLGPVDLLVTSAGIALYQPHGEMTFESWRRVMRVNLDGSFLPLLATKDGMVERGYGRVVCLTSIGGLRPRDRMIAYSAAKAGIVGMVRSFAAALAPAVRVNAVAPGPTETDMMAELPGMLDPERLAALPLGRLATAEEIADVILYLLSDGSAMLTGQTLAASGGEVMLP